MPYATTFRPRPVLRSDSTHAVARSERSDGARGDAASDDGGWHGSLALGFERRGQATILSRRLHRGPLRVQKPLYQEGEDVCQAVIVHPPGGIVGGDRLETSIDVSADAHALITTPGATKWYRSAGATARQAITMRLQTGARLEWLPQETILHAGATAEQHIEVELAAAARYIGWELSCLGRAASGESFDRGLLSQRVSICMEGRLLFVEHAHIEGGSRLLQSAAGLAGHHVSGLMLVVAVGIDKTLVDALREAQPASPHLAGITRLGAAAPDLPDVIAVRYLGDSAETARRYFEAVRSCVRPIVFGRAAVAPRIWNC